MYISIDIHVIYYIRINTMYISINIIFYIYTLTQIINIHLCPLCNVIYSLLFRASSFTYSFNYALHYNFAEAIMSGYVSIPF